MTTIRTECHRVPWGIEWYAIDDDTYDGIGSFCIAGLGATEAEAVADLIEQLDEKGIPHD